MVALVSDSEKAERERRPEGASLQYIGSDTEELSQVMKEQLMLFDPKPLMKPTQWNWANFERMEDYSIPRNFDYASVREIRAESRDKLSRIQPLTLGQASRIAVMSGRRGKSRSRPAWAATSFSQ